MTANPWAYTIHCVAGAEAVNTGKIPPEQLGVRALDTFAVQVDLRAPEPAFLKLCYTFLTLPLPCHAIDAARARGREASWTDPGRMVSSGPFLLKESRPHERIVLSKNPNYFDAPIVRVEEIHFFADDGVTALKLFQAGMVDAMDGNVLPRQFVPKMRKRAELQMGPACACHNWRISAKRAPLNNVRLRYALNMATDKDATAHFWGRDNDPPSRESRRSKAIVLYRICRSKSTDARATFSPIIPARPGNCGHELPLQKPPIRSQSITGPVPTVSFWRKFFSRSGAKTSAWKPGSCRRNRQPTSGQSSRMATLRELPRIPTLPVIRIRTICCRCIRCLIIRTGPIRSTTVCSPPPLRPPIQDQRSGPRSSTM